ncbi:thioredoxin [Amylibacter ulvae]|uniref:Thioredoxin n=1 Tax=Paramylibacter ulvae TaxID=1651968 RepID=A0ABQ3D3C0_9RHOB|nr:TlpA disulfide reductase family protein [Amylibacter ulvae]GHA56548.1 thioredoxin [Amylibacter ulvae]
MTLGKSIVAGMLYTAMLAGANPSFGQNAELTDIRAMIPADAVHFIIHNAPKPVTTAAFINADGSQIDLSQFHGQTIVLNFWATWCAPCVAEMPSLDTLQATMGSETFQVVTVAAGRNPLPMIERFFERENLTNLPKYRDPDMKFAKEMGVRGLPVTVIINPEGQEIARTKGEAIWDAPDMLTLLRKISQP